jgi:hypothetical protein
MSDRHGIIESMFEVRLPDVEALGGLDDAGLVDTMRCAVRMESAVIARKFAATVCSADPRTKAQRRADALSAVAARATAMACACGSPDCPAAKQGATVGDVVIHVLADAATVSGDSTAPGYVPGFGGLSAEAVRQLTISAKRRPLVHPKDCAPRAAVSAVCGIG